jgi:hypothetical protein
MLRIAPRAPQQASQMSLPPPRGTMSEGLSLAPLLPGRSCSPMRASSMHLPEASLHSSLGGNRSASQTQSHLREARSRLWHPCCHFHRISLLLRNAHSTSSLDRDDDEPITPRADAIAFQSGTSESSPWKGMMVAKPRAGAPEKPSFASLSYREQSWLLSQLQDCDCPWTTIEPPTKVDQNDTHSLAHRMDPESLAQECIVSMARTRIAASAMVRFAARRDRVLARPRVPHERLPAPATRDQDGSSEPREPREGVPGSG